MSAQPAGATFLRRALRGRGGAAAHHVQAARGPGRRWRRLARLSGGLSLLLLFIAAAGITYQAVETARDRDRYPPPGKLVDVGGYRLHVNCVGEGGPTVVVEAGAGNWSASWAGLLEGLARKAGTRVCAYDRAGLGWSDPSPHRPTADQLVSDLHALLSGAQINPPYVLVGHSLGGYLVRVYAGRYPAEVAGIAFVESAHERQWRYLPKAVGEFADSQADSLRVASLAARFGVLRLMKNSLPLPKLSPEAQAAYEAAMLRPETYCVLAEEVRMGRADAAGRAALVNSLGAMPVAVVSARRSFDAFKTSPNAIPLEEANRRWMELQADLLKLSADSRHFVGEGTHNIQLDDPQLVSDAIEQVVAAARGGRARPAHSR